jgi:hypothetical protein
LLLPRLGIVREKGGQCGEDHEVLLVEGVGLGFLLH